MTETNVMPVLHVGRPNIGDRARFYERLDGALDRGWLTNNGPLVQEFEERVRAVAGTRHCVAVSNATTGLQVAMKASGLRPGDEVIVPSFTWIATAHALDWVGLVPVFCDIDEETAGADPDHVAALITERTRAVLGVHVFGRPADITALTRVARDHGVALFFDAAHAFGNTYGGRPIGGFGRAEVFSFHATKYINSFEGGAIVTDDDDLADKMRLMRNMGLGSDRSVRSSGTVARMSEASAAMGLTSLDSMASILEVNQRNHAEYVRALADIPGVRIRSQMSGERSNHQYVVAEIETTQSGVGRDAVHAALVADGVLSRPYFSPCCHQQEPYRSAPQLHAPDPLPRTEGLSRRVLALPTGTSIGPREINRVCDRIRSTLVPAPPQEA